MHLSDFDYELPADLIAQQPLDRRTDSRLLHLRYPTGARPEAGALLADRSFTDLPELLRAGDLLVVNDSKVIAARLLGRKETGGQVEVMVERLLDAHRALALIKASKSPRPGTIIELDSGQRLEVGGRQDMFFEIRFEQEAEQVIQAAGRLPLPPYIERAAGTEDDARYQTVYARNAGSVAAPTAGLHFDDALLQTLEARGIEQASVTLHVGAGTFAPVRVEQIAEHRMHAERFWIPPETVAAVRRTRARGGRVVAVGTTSLRSLESAADGLAGRGINPGNAETRLFITPGYRFQVVDALVTNFHLPRSTLLMLVASMAGLPAIRQAYAHAIERRYRFFSYGDAMLIEPDTPANPVKPGSHA
ncbi:MAG: tRNA preQ1(34) S-adenosylmethionine ribosyltransferase-isomerase QueA [Burkholderiaceae bacterium]